jgi:hypothetical protein
VRLLVIGDPYEAWRISIGDPVASLGSLLTWSAAWFVGLLALFSFFGVRVYRRT